jgi:predicted transcriptional regulator YdeE
MAETLKGKFTRKEASGMQIIKTQLEHFPALRLIGKRYTLEDQTGGSFDDKWSEFHETGWMTQLEALGPSAEVESGPLGLMTMGTDHHEVKNSGFSYWIGLLFPAGTEVPAGFACLDLPESDVGVAWIYGSDETGEIWGPIAEQAAYAALEAAGIIGEGLNENAAGENLMAYFERYHAGRIDAPDEKGNVILDFGFYLKGTEGYQPRKPEILSMAQTVQASAVQQTVIQAKPIKIMQKDEILLGGFHAGSDIGTRWDKFEREEKIAPLTNIVNGIGFEQRIFSQESQQIFTGVEVADRNIAHNWELIVIPPAEYAVYEIDLQDDIDRQFDEIDPYNADYVLIWHGRFEEENVLEMWVPNK